MDKKESFEELAHVYENACDAHVEKFISVIKSTMRKAYMHGWEDCALQNAESAVTSNNTTQAEICSNKVCYYCKNFDGEHCNTRCSVRGGNHPSAFAGRKLSAMR